MDDKRMTTDEFEATFEPLGWALATYGFIDYKGREHWLFTAERENKKKRLTDSYTWCFYTTDDSDAEGERLLVLFAERVRCIDAE